jgi:hypothetical protein
MLIVFSLILTVILNRFLAIPILNFLSTFMDFSIFRSISSIEFLAIIVPIFIIMPTIGIYYLLRKLNFDQKLQNMKVVKIIFSTILVLFVFYIILLLLSTTVQGGGLTFGIRMIFAIYGLPILALLLIIAMIMIVKKLVESRKYTYKHIPLSNKETGLIRYTSIVSILIILFTLLNPYGNIFKNFQNNNIFQELCQNAKTTVYEEVVLDSIFLHTNWQSRYCNIDDLGHYGSAGGGILSYPKIVLDTNVTFEVPNKNKKTNQEFKYKYYDAKNYRNGVESKIIKSKYKYIENQIYNENSIIGTSVKIIRIDNNKTIAESIYYVSPKVRKVCGDLVHYEEFGEKCLKPFYLVTDMIEKKKTKK